MLSLTSEYALRALIYLTRNENEWPIPGWQVADGAGIPPKYLSKILGDLVRIGVLSSAPGKRGGFRLNQPAKKTRLFEILVPYESFGRKRCPFGNEDCSDEYPCSVHKKWKGVMQAEQRFFQKTSLYEIAQELKSSPAKKKVKVKAKAKKNRST